jgi:hypothetical protein
MAPVPALIAGGVPQNAAAYALGQAGREYAVYVAGGTRADLVLDLPAGRYRAEWLNPRTGKIEKTADLDHTDGRATLASPEYSEDIALGITLRP